MADYPPPPPYTPSSSTQYDAVDAPILTPTSSIVSPPYGFNDDNNATDTLFSSSAEYFNSRPPPSQQPPNILSFCLTLPSERLNVSSLFSSLQMQWRDRDVTPQDWATFVSHLIPYYDVDYSTQAIEKAFSDSKLIDRDETSILADEKTPSDHGRLVSPADQESRQHNGQYNNRKLTDVVNHWNLCFFRPRGLEIVVNMSNREHDRGPTFSRSTEAEDQALLRFVAKGDKKMVKAFLDGGANVDATDIQGEASLIRAVQRGDTSVVKLLVSYGANVDVAFQGQTALYRAVARGDTSVVKLLVREVKGINARSNGETALFRACSKGDSSIVKLLLEHPAIDVNTSSDDGEKAFHRAVSKGEGSIVKAFLEHQGIEVDAPDIEGNTPLYKAVCRSDTSITKRLLAYGAKGEKRAMLKAAEKGDTSIVKLLSESNSN
ncbi:MAG: hypothetical protein Q9190_002820 [Brigantiaea leucoxantha]